MIARHLSYRKLHLLSDLSIDELARRCRQESDRFLAGQPSDEAYGLELFRRAITNGDQAAWQTIYAQYQTLLAYWVRGHSRFHSTQEEVTFFVNAAFARFWRTASERKTKLQFVSLASLLAYLKACVHSAIEDECRRRQRWPRDVLGWDNLPGMAVDDAPTPEARAISRITAESLQEAVMSRLRGEQEKAIAVLGWAYELSPREIQACRPDLFADVGRVYQVKRNLLNRLLRDPFIQQLLKAVH